MSACKHCSGQLRIVGDILNPRGMECVDCGKAPDPIVAAESSAPKERYDPVAAQAAWIVGKFVADTPPIINAAGEEGGPCPDCMAPGLVLRHRRDDGCTCFVKPPCSYCMSEVPECLACGWRAEEP